MTSLQCHRSAQETYETKCNDNSVGYKVADVVFKGNHHGHHASNQGHCYGQASGYHHPDHTISKTQTQTNPDHTVAKTHCTQCVSQSHGHGHHVMAHSQSHNHGHSMGQHQSRGMACHGKTEKKMKNKYEYKNKKTYSYKRRDENWSCSDNSSDSECD